MGRGGSIPARVLAPHRQMRDAVNRRKCSLLPCETERIQFSKRKGAHKRRYGAGGRRKRRRMRGRGNAREKLTSFPPARPPPLIPRSPTSQPRLTVRIAASCRFFRPHLVGGGSRQKQRGYIGNRFVSHVAFPLTRALGAPLRTGRRGRDPVHQRGAIPRSRGFFQELPNFRFASLSTRHG